MDFIRVVSFDEVSDSSGHVVVSSFELHDYMLLVSFHHVNIFCFLFEGRC